MWVLLLELKLGEKNQTSLHQIPPQHSTLHKSLPGEENEGLYAEDYKAAGQKMVAGEGTHMRFVWHVCCWISVVFSRGRSGRSKMLGNRSTGEEGRSWTEGMEQRCQASVLDQRWQKGWGYRLRNMHYRRLEKGWRYSSAKAVAALSLGAPQANKLWDAPHQMTGEEPSRELQSCQYAALKSFQTHQVP